MFNPVNPAKTPSASTAHKPQPRLSIAWRIRSMDAADSAAVKVLGK
jgi:hypothetical protein